MQQAFSGFSKEQNVTFAFFRRNFNQQFKKAQTLFELGLFVICVPDMRNFSLLNFSVSAPLLFFFLHETRQSSNLFWLARIFSEIYEHYRRIVVVPIQKLLPQRFYFCTIQIKTNFKNMQNCICVLQKGRLNCQPIHQLVFVWKRNQGQLVVCNNFVVVNSAVHLLPSCIYSSVGV